MASGQLLQTVQSEEHNESLRQSDPLNNDLEDEGGLFCLDEEQAKSTVVLQYNTDTDSDTEEGSEVLSRDMHSPAYDLTPTKSQPLAYGTSLPVTIPAGRFWPPNDAVDSIDNKHDDNTEITVKTLLPQRLHKDMYREMQAQARSIQPADDPERLFGERPQRRRYETGDAATPVNITGQSARVIVAASVTSHMQMKTRIPLEELLLDSPQNRTLVRLFEEDTYNLRSWGHQLRSALDDWCVAQRTATAAASKLASVIAAYNVQFQKLPLDVATYEMPSLTKRLAQNVDEIASWMELLVQQVGFCVQGPINKAVQEMDQLVESERPAYADALHYALEAYQLLSVVYYNVLFAYDITMKGSNKLQSNMADADERFARAGRKETGRKLGELSNDVFISRMSYHKYCSRMNVLQSRRYNELIEPLLMLVYAFKCFFNVGHDAFSKGSLTQFLTQAQQHMLTIGEETEKDRAENNQLLNVLSELCNKKHNMYYAEQPQSVSTVCDDVQRQGYLRIRLKSGLFTNNWHKYYVFTQGTKLMWQKADQLAGSLMLDVIQVPGTCAQVTESADRRFVFSVCLPACEEFNEERRWMLQARNTLDMQLWVSVINNLAGMQLHSDEAAPPSQTPIQFDVFDNCEQDSLPSDLLSEQHLHIRFLGRVQLDRTSKDLDTAIDQVLTARRTHGIVDSTACALIATPNDVLLVSQQKPIHVKTRIRMTDIDSWNVSHTDNTVLGFLSSTTDQAEPGNSAVDICNAFQEASSRGYTCNTATADNVNGAEAESVKDHSATVEMQGEVVGVETQGEVVGVETQGEVVGVETQRETGATGVSTDTE